MPRNLHANYVKLLIVFLLGVSSMLAIFIEFLCIVELLRWLINKFNTRFNVYGSFMRSIKYLFIFKYLFMLPIRLLSQSVILGSDCYIWFWLIMYVFLYLFNLVNTLSKIYQVNDNTVDVPIDRIVLDNAGEKAQRHFRLRKPTDWNCANKLYKLIKIIK